MAGYREAKESSRMELLELLLHLCFGALDWAPDLLEFLFEMVLEFAEWFCRSDDDRPGF
jgi:hypothetical protein